MAVMFEVSINRREIVHVPTKRVLAMEPNQSFYLVSPANISERYVVVT